MKTLWLVCAIVFSASAFVQPARATTPELALGQEWSIKSEPPTTVKVIIGRIEPWAQQIAVNVSLIDVPVPACAGGTPGTVTTIGDLPFDQSTLTASLDQLLATNVAPDGNFEAGYNQWKKAKGGIFTISVPEAVALIFRCK